MAVVLGTLAVWLNGPGFRRLAPAIGARWLARSGIDVSFTVTGTLTGGFSVQDLHLSTQGTLAKLTIARLSPIYQLRDLYRGKPGGLVVDTADIRLDLDRRPDVRKNEQKAAASFDPGTLAGMLRDVRRQILPLELRLRNIQASAVRDGKESWSLGPSELIHAAGGDQIRLALGSFRNAAGGDSPAQETVIQWQEDSIAIDTLAVLPGLALRDVSLQLPSETGPSASGLLQTDEALFMMESGPGFASIQMDLREGTLQIDQVAQRFGITLPANGRLTSLTLNLENVFPDPRALTGEAAVLLEDITTRDGWALEELSLAAAVNPTEVTLTAGGRLDGSEIRLSSRAPLERDSPWQAPREIEAQLEIPNLAETLAALSPRLPALKHATQLPASRLGGSFQVQFTESSQPVVRGRITADPEDPALAAGLVLETEWQKDRPLPIHLTTEGLAIDGTWDPAKGRYDATFKAQDFNSRRIGAWLAGFGIETTMTAELTADWKGSGEIPSGTHQGTLNLASLRLIRPEMPPLLASATAGYQWPGKVEVSHLNLTADSQSFRAAGRIDGGWIELNDFSWRHRDRELATAAARLPLPADVARWRQSLAAESRPLAASIHTNVLPVGLLADWLPQAKNIDPAATGQLNVQLAGTFSAPEIRANLDLQNLKTAAQPDLPPAQLKLSLDAAHGQVTTGGTLTVSGFAPASISAGLPFRPAAWLDAPAAILDEPLTAKVDLPRIDLARFSTMVPAASRITGTLSGHLSARGPLTRPQLEGRLDLANGSLVPKGPSLPAIDSLSASVLLKPDKITLQTLKANLASGTLDAAGALDLRQFQPANLDLRLTARHLPIRRDESLILRSHADLRLAGPWDKAKLSGTLAVVDSLFYRDIELLPIGTPFTTPSAASLPRLDASPKPASSLPAPFRNWALDVRLRTADPFLIRGNVATGRIDADVRIGGTLADPRPAGEAILSDFRAALPFSTLMVKSGKLRFQPANGFDPILEIRGTAEPRPYRVSLHVYGRASDPQLLMTSSPPLPDNEIMTLLATGTTTTGLENPQVASSRAMQLLAEEMRRGRFAVGKQLRPLLGMLDRVDFSLAETDPYTSERFSTATLSITDRWYLSAGMGEEGDSRVFAVWRLSFR